MSYTTLTNYKQINELYKKNFDEKPFSQIETEIFNSNGTADHTKYDMSNPENVHSFYKYYSIEQNNEGMLECANILIKMEDVRGYFNIGNYYLGKQDTEKAKKYWKKASDLNFVLATFNLAFCETKDKNYDDAIKYALKCIDMKHKPAYILIVGIYAEKNDLKNMELYLIEGIKAECSNCLDIFCCQIEDNTAIFEWILKLPFTNNMLIEKKNKISKLVDQNIVNANRGKPICFINEDNDIFTTDGKHVCKLTNDNDKSNIINK
jgi:tetratricopeptide (TPR) repeat protein